LVKIKAVIYNICLSGYILTICDRPPQNRECMSDFQEQTFATILHWHWSL